MDATAPGQLRFRLLGEATLRIAGTDSRRALPQKGLALLVYLAMNRDRFVSRAELADLLWSDRIDSQARQNLRQCILTLRRDFGPALGRALVVADQSLALAVDGVEVDALQFVACAGVADPTERRRCLDLPWGPFLGSFSIGVEGFDEWAVAERQRLDATAARVFAELAEQFDTAGDGELAIAALERLIAIDPAEEHRHRRLLALEARIRGADAALARGKTLIGLLKREFDAKPESATLAMLEDIRRSARTQLEDVQPTATKPHDELIPIWLAATAPAPPLGATRVPRVIAACAVNGTQRPPTSHNVLRRLSRTIPAHELRILSVAAAAFMFVAFGIIYLLGPLVRAANLGHVRLGESVPMQSLSRRTFRDCEDCPEMVALSAGEFMMGSLEDEPWREPHEGLPRRVVIKKPIAIGKFEVTVDQFSTFVTETRMSAGNLCRVIVGDNGKPGRSFIMGPPESSFREPGFPVVGTHPAVCISWDDAERYVAWLKGRTGKPYRLPTEAEWEYAARAGTQTIYSFGNEPSTICAFGRFADPDSSFPWREGCGPAAAGPIPVGQLMPNPWGIFDMHGNAWEWVEDCWTPNTSEIPADGSPFSRPNGCSMRVIRGGSWANGPSRLRSAARREMGRWSHYNNVGFRIALSLGE